MPDSCMCVRARSLYRVLLLHCHAPLVCGPVSVERWLVLQAGAGFSSFGTEGHGAHNVQLAASGYGRRDQA
jgi:hypothetical protein